jgi:hypothetical protein
MLQCTPARADVSLESWKDSCVTRHCEV